MGKTRNAVTPEPEKGKCSSCGRCSECGQPTPQIVYYPIPTAPLVHAVNGYCWCGVWHVTALPTMAPWQPVPWQGTWTWNPDAPPIQFWAATDSSPNGASLSSGFTPGATSTTYVQQ